MREIDRLNKVYYYISYFFIKVSLGVIKTEKDTSEYERAAERHGGGQQQVPSIGGGGGTPAVAPPAAQTLREYEPGSKTCNVCNRVLSSPEACVSHIANHHKEDFHMFACDVCHWAFESQMQRNVHRKKHKGPGGGPAPAKDAAAVTSTASPLKVNFPFQKSGGGGGGGGQKGKDSASLTCLFCGRVMISREALKTHQNHHCDESFQFMECPDCSQCYENHALFGKHRREDHHDNAPAPSPGGGRASDAYVSFVCKVLGPVYSCGFSYLL